ncbi:toxin YafO, type II toxin-antitoxin system family protein, partial [Klebsiella pneumoniae]
SSGNKKQIPTSDSYLIYAVCENRNAGVLDFWFPPAHKEAEFEPSVQGMVELADKFYEKISGKPMGRDKEPWHSDFLV